MGMGDLLALSGVLNVTLDMINGFVGRHKELESLRSAFVAGVRGVIVFGPPGSGKTWLARLFAERYKDEFPGGISVGIVSLAESPDALLRRVIPEAVAPGPRLVIVDEVDVLDEPAVHQLHFALGRDPHLRMLLTSRHDLSLGSEFHRIELQGFSRVDFEEFLRLKKAFSNERLDERLTERLFEASGGNALFATLAVEAVQRGVVGSWRELFDNLRNFQVPGVLGPDGHPIDTKSKMYQRVVIDVSAANEEVLRLLQKQPDLAWRLPPRRFEEIVAEILSRQGYQIELTPASGDGGFDIYAARQDGLGKFLYLVECKRYVPPNKVGVEIVRALYGILQTRRATAGAIVTTSYFTAGAQELQREIQHQLHLHDYIVLQKWIKEFPDHAAQNA